MKGDWIKIRSGLRKSIEVTQIASALSKTPDQIVLGLYSLAEWISIHGKYGKISCAPELLDKVAEIDGIANELLEVGWLRMFSDSITLTGFTDAAACRKALGTRLRRNILSEGKCRACGSAYDLTVDHVVPISRGGTSSRENLQPLCRPCNIRKGKKTMEEFLIKTTAASRPCQKEESR